MVYVYLGVWVQSHTMKLCQKLITSQHQGQLFQIEINLKNKRAKRIKIGCVFE